MKVSKEFKTGLVVIFATLLLIYGVNYLKGNSFFGGDDVYYAFFPTSGSLTPSSPVTLNGVEIGKILDVRIVSPSEYVDPKKRILVKFSIQNPEMRLAVGSDIQIVPGVLSTSVQINQNFIADKGYYRVGDTLIGSVSQEIQEQLEVHLLPLKRKMEDLMVSVDNIVASINAFWDTSAAYTMDAGLNEIKIAISRFSKVAYNLDNLIDDQKIKLSNIFDNVENITANLVETDKQIKSVVGNISNFTDTLMTVDFKNAIAEATVTMRRLNGLLETSSQGEGTIGKLLNDDQLYDELNRTNERLQELVQDLKEHPERYIHMSVFGTRIKGVPLTKQEERKLKAFLDTLPKINE
ncbi:MAG: MCE family protein [Crocinitomicaceae bacterium]|nr:MCE family protein [Crocinitomicaceae bacterium]